MKNDHTQWDKWNEVQKRRQSKKSISELSNAGYTAYRQSRYDTAARLFAQAVELAKQQHSLADQCNNLNWEGECYYQDKQLKKALTCFLQAEKLNGLDGVHHFYNLVSLVCVALSIPLPIHECKDMLEKLTSYKTAQQIGGSKSMVLYCEYDLLSSRGMDDEALEKIQEAFESRVDSAPFYNDILYFSKLVNAYRISNHMPEAWSMLRRWRVEGSIYMADVKAKQLKEEAKLFYTERNYNAAWDFLQRCYSEERYISRAGKNVGTLYWLIQVGTELGYFKQLRPYVQYLFQFRHSESGFTRYICYRSIAIYFCKQHIWGQQLPHNLDKVRRHAEFWLTRAERAAQELDGLLECNWRTQSIKRMRSEFEATN